MTTAPSIEEWFEGSTPLARKLAALGPYSSLTSLIAQARELAPTLTEEEVIATLNGHPRIGEDPARMSPRSRAEQGDDVLPELSRLNREYERRFGFRFVVFVNRRPKSEIIEVLRQRLRRSRREEMQAGLQAVIDIAEDRARA
ncbi:MAG TPA: 2-oxo-4-hydroxy-4-carboxy-5-ureidoimidazoline decarboxylase [Candidatus Limnocylindrales bacterium]|nr:2-oxo-4-hydroxy-4-carboxy-5-ureidoimidazoline decarboxylase [Candidatus Limnocylindrales bacterium]